MKNFIYTFALILMSGTSFAQETIPLFGEESYTTPQSQISQTQDKSIKNQQSGSSAQNNSDMPLIGRNAPPLSKLVLEPIPNLPFTININQDDTPKKKTPDKQFNESVITESDLIKREKPLNITESKNKKDKINANSVSAADLQRHDVSKFKVVGIAFGDDSETVNDTLSDLGYTLTKVEKSIPLHRTTYYNEACREKGLKLSSDIRNCVLNYAEADEMHYVFRETYKRPQSRETVQVSYSTPETDNVAYMIVYENRGDTSLNSSRINMAKKIRRRDDFWNLMFKTYGLPDDNDKLLWGDEDSRYMKAFMTGSAYHAYVVMEDKLLQDKDYDAAQNDFNTLRQHTPFTLTGKVLPEYDDADSVVAEEREALAELKEAEAEENETDDDEDTDDEE